MAGESELESEFAIAVLEAAADQGFDIGFIVDNEMTYSPTRARSARC